MSGLVAAALGKMALQVSANLTTLFPECGTLLHRYSAAKRAGFRVVEVSLPYSEKAENLAKVIAEEGLQQVLINTDPGCREKGEMGFACIPGREREFKDSLQKSIMYAKALSVPMIHIMVGKSVETQTEEAHMSTLHHNLTYAAELFKQEGIIGVIEPKNNITFPGYFLNDFDKAVDLISKIDSPHLRLLLDIFHLQLICGKITHNIERLIPYTAHVQVSQPPSRSEPCSDGELNFPFIINKLKSVGYKGYIGAEYVPSTKKTEDSLGWIEQCGLTL